ncbi:MAG TPA: response regulator [Caulobacteraceae bacterium]
MSGGGASSERALILAPIGRDGQIARLIVGQAGFEGEVCPDLAALVAELDAGAGVAIIAEEAVRDTDLRPLIGFLGRQPPWSDLPIILMTERGGGREPNPAAVRLGEGLGKVSFLERPFHPATLASLVRSAIRGRRRQYDARQMLEDLAASTRQLETALRAGQLGPWTLYLPDLVLAASDICAAQYGRPPGASLSYQEWQASVHPDDAERVHAAAGQTMRSGEDYVIEYRVVWPDGSVHWVDVRARTVKNSTGQVVELIGVSSEITARKSFEHERESLVRELAAERKALSDLTRSLELRVEERTAELASEVAARERAQDQLLQSQKMESLGQLTGGVAHDFNNLLMVVLGNLQLLAKHTAGDPRAQRLIEVATQGAERGAALTQRMLAFARQQELKTAATDLAALVGGMRELLERSLGPRIVLTLNVPASVPAVEVDPNQVELAILNLAINARDSMPEGGPINIGVSERALAGVGDSKARPGVQVQVSDAGFGMDAETLRKAADPFFSTKPVGKGTGLGLSMVDGLARQLGGVLELASEVGKGAVATMWFPLGAGPSLPAAPPAAAGRRGRRAKVLLVDDDALICASTADMLEDLGHTVVRAESGQKALELLRAGQRVDLMMTDYAMPGMTGLELASAARGQRPDLPILLVTGFADPPAAQAMDLPRLSKPYHQADLQAHIDSLLARPGRNRPTAKDVSA